METLTFIQQFASPTLDAIFRLLTGLGSSEAYIVLLLTVYLAVDAPLGQRLGVLVLFGFYLNFHLKGIVESARPFDVDPAVARTPEAAATSGPGFPSAHAQSSLTFWGYAAWWLQRPWFWAVAAVVVFLISLSRLYLGMHFPVDIVGGLAIGAVYTAVVVFAEPLWRSFKRISKAPRVFLGLLLPLALMLILPPPGQEPDLIMGGLAAFLSAPLLLPYTPPQGLWSRLGVALLGIALVFGVLLLSSEVLPEALKRNPLGGFIRYLLVAGTGLLAVPWLAQRLQLAPAAPGHAES